jgi:hypothetical protein
MLRHKTEFDVTRMTDKKIVKKASLMRAASLDKNNPA